MRIVGGKGKDFIANTSKSSKRNTIIYDNKDEKNTIGEDANAKLVLSDKEWVNAYSPNSFTYDKKSFGPSLDYNADDRIFLGLSFERRHFGFRTDPASYTQKISGNFAPKTAAYTIRYDASFYSLFGRNTDLVLNAEYNGPKYTFNYYGQGNSTANIGDNITYYRVRSKNLSLKSFIQYRFTKAFKVGVGPGFEHFKIETPANRFISRADFPERGEIENPSRFGTLRLFGDIDFVDNPAFPTSGIRWRSEINYFDDLSPQAYQFLQLQSHISFYGTPNLSFPVTVAVRLGAATHFGNYKFFQANSLGNNTYLRGYRNNRFSGRSYLYQNAELRFTVTNIRNYLFTGKVGVFGFVDAGRVFSDLPENSNWHSGYGPGIWLNLYNLFMVSTSWGISKEGKYFLIKSGITF